jgi:hypothetical protein
MGFKKIDDFAADLKNIVNRQIHKINRIYSAIQRSEKPIVRLP